MTSISTLSTYQKSINSRTNIADQDAKVQKAQYELTTGFKSDVYADNRFNAAQSLDLRNRLSRMESYSVSNALLNGKIEIMAKTMSDLHSDVQEFFSTTLALSSGTQADHVVQPTANSLLSRVSSYLNTVYAGEYLFSGIASSVASVTLDNGQLGPDTLDYSSDLAAVQQKIAEYDAFFELGSAPSATSYSGTAAKASAEGQQIQIDENRVMQIGITSQDESLRYILKGIAMLASTDISRMQDVEAREAWSLEARTVLTKGLNGLQDRQIALGYQQTEISRTAEHQQKLITVYNNRVVDLEGVDSYEAATRLEALSTQLEASYAVTARLKNLTLLSYL